MPIQPAVQPGDEAAAQPLLAYCSCNLSMSSSPSACMVAIPQAHDRSRPQVSRLPTYALVGVVMHSFMINKPALCVSRVSLVLSGIHRLTDSSVCTACSAVRKFHAHVMLAAIIPPKATPACVLRCRICKGLQSCFMLALMASLVAGKYSTRGPSLQQRVPSGRALSSVL